MRYLLDSNAVIAVMADQPTIMVRIAQASPYDVGLSTIVLFELMYGAFNSVRVPENLERLEELAFPLINFEHADARAAGEIRATLKRRGTPIGPYDVMIAGQAMARGLTLVTANVWEFGRVDGLRVENWCG